MTDAGLHLRPITIAAAKRVVGQWHRHLPPPQGARFALGAYTGDTLRGVALVGNPVARMTAREWWAAEVVRVATDGTPNVCSFLYARAKRAAQAMGYTRVITKTLPEEGGASLRAVGAQLVGVSRGGQWNRANRHRAEAHRPDPKLRWEL